MGKVIRRQTIASVISQSRYENVLIHTGDLHRTNDTPPSPRSVFGIHLGDSTVHLSPERMIFKARLMHRGVVEEDTWVRLIECESGKGHGILTFLDDSPANWAFCK